VSTSSYPSEWERSACTRDGVPYRIRPIRPDDLGREREFIRGLSAETRYNRLLHGLREPPPGFIERLVDVDYCRAMAFVAVVGEGADERIIGVARYAAPATGSECEFAVTVADEWQCRGIGSTLARLLFDYACARGFSRIYGTILASNLRMLNLVRRLGMGVRREPGNGALLEAWLDLQPAEPRAT
jgi:acetyltransferase